MVLQLGNKGEKEIRRGSGGNKQKIAPYIDDIEAITDRIIRIQFRGIVKTNIIGIYAPTATREE